jgi:hypothetical protein
VRHFTRVIAICFAVSIPLTIACASSDESETGLAQPKKDAGKDTGAGGGNTGGTGGGTGGAATGGTGGGTGGATGGTGGGTGGGNTGGSGGGGTCNVDFCPTPAPPATKCCVTANGPCGVDYGQGQGCQGAGSGGAGP